MKRRNRVGKPRRLWYVFETEYWEEGGTVVRGRSAGLAKKRYLEGVGGHTHLTAVAIPYRQYKSILARAEQEEAYLAKALADADGLSSKLLDAIDSSTLLVEAP